MLDHNIMAASVFLFSKNDKSSLKHNVKSLNNLRYLKFDIYILFQNLHYSMYSKCSACIYDIIL